VDLKNPYNILKRDYPNAFIPGRTDKFAIQLLAEKFIENNFGDFNTFEQ